MMITITFIVKWCCVVEREMKIPAASVGAQDLIRFYCTVHVYSSLFSLLIGWGSLTAQTQRERLD